MRFLARIPFIGSLFKERHNGPVSLVMLTAEVPSIDEAQVEKAVRSCLSDFSTEMLGELPFPSPPDAIEPAKFFMFSVESAPFGVVVACHPYLEDQAGFADTLTRPDLADAIRAHKGWVSVDAVGKVPENIAYEIIGRVAAVLLPNDTRAFYMPNRQRFSFPSPGLTNALRTGNWIPAFDQVGSDPVVHRPIDDDALEEATRAARARFPEFVRTYEEGTATSHAVKAAFTEQGETEHMWVQVEQILPDRIVGTLDNEPRYVKRHRSGDSVTVSIEDVSDWTYSVGETVQGGFSIKVLTQDHLS